MVVVSDSAFVLWHILSHTPVCFCSIDVCDSNCLCFAGSQQSQDQTSRRSGNAGEKHNENGVRLKNPQYNITELELDVIETSHSQITFLCLQNK